MSAWFRRNLWGLGPAFAIGAIRLAIEAEKELTAATQRQREEK